MEAVLLVGGMGTRLRPLTATTPKPMLPTAGVPFLTHVLARARESGVDHVVLATSYRSEVFADHFGDGSRLGLAIDYVTETEPLGTGGGMRNVAGLLSSRPDDPVVIINGDVLSGHDIAAQVEAHLAAGADVTLHLTEVADPRAFGCCPTDRGGRITDFLEKSPNPVTNQVNAGCYVFRRRVIDAIPAGRPVSVERETFPDLLRDGAFLLGHLDPAYWLDLGTPEAFIRGSCDLVLGRLRSPALPGEPGESLVLPGAVVDATAVVAGGTTVGARAVVAAGAEVHGSVLMDGAVVGEGALVRDSVLGRDAEVGPGSSLSGTVVGDHAVVAAGNELVAGARVWNDVRIPEGAIRFSPDRPSA
ncbi:MAG: NDP-sugar synthase [Sporichthyaceae bacterium]